MYRPIPTQRQRFRSLHIAFRVLNPFANAPHHDEVGTTITQKIQAFCGSAQRSQKPTQKFLWLQVLGPVTELSSRLRFPLARHTSADQACVRVARLSHQTAIDALLSDYQRLVAISSPC